jgi:hypothetical protein
VKSKKGRFGPSANNWKFRGHKADTQVEKRYLGHPYRLFRRWSKDDRHGNKAAGMTRRDLKRPAVVTLLRCVVPNIGRQLILERRMHGVAEQFQSRVRPEGNRALHNQPLLVVRDDLQALELVAIHGPHPAQEGGALIELKLGRIGTGTTRSARLSSAPHSLSYVAMTL